MSTYPKVSFNHGNEPRDEFEASQRGYRDGVRVELADGRLFDLVIYDPIRLAQDIERLAECGQPYFVEPAMVVVSEVTTGHIISAIRALSDGGYFDRILASNGG